MRENDIAESTTRAKFKDGDGFSLQWTMVLVARGPTADIVDVKDEISGGTLGGLRRGRRDAEEESVIHVIVVRAIEEASAIFEVEWEGFVNHWR